MEADQDVEEHTDHGDAYCQHGVGTHVISHGGAHFLYRDNAQLLVGHGEVFGVHDFAVDCELWLQCGVEQAGDVAVYVFRVVVDTVVSRNTYFFVVVDGDYTQAHRLVDA